MSTQRYTAHLVGHQNIERLEDGGGIRITVMHRPNKEQPWFDQTTFDMPEGEAAALVAELASVIWDRLQVNVKLS